MTVANGLFSPVPSPYINFARLVCGRCGGMKCLFNNHFKSLWFFYRSPWVAQHSEPVSGGRSLGAAEVEVAVRSIRAAMGAKDYDDGESPYERGLADRRRKFDDEMEDRLIPEAVRRFSFTMSRAHLVKQKPWVANTTMFSTPRRRRRTAEVK